VIERALTHRLFAPALVGAIFGLGALAAGFLLVGPGLGPWADALLTACFGWSAETRRYRLDALLLTLLQPPLFAGVVFLFYREELLASLASRRGRLAAAAAPAVFLALAASLLATTEISASGAPPEALPAPIREGRPAPAFSLVDHRGARVALEDLRGRPVAMTFFYAGCHASCPVLIQRLKALEAAMPGADAAFLALSLYPERDTPAALAETAARWRLGPRWHLLTGSPAAVRAALDAYGVQRTPLPDGEIAHENLIVLVDRRGRLAFTYRGLAHPEARQAADLARLAAERG
jgi:protein SCO1/2